MLRRIRLVGFGIAAIAGIDAQLANAQLLYSENFDGLALQDSVNERLGKGNVTRVATDPASNAYPDAFAKADPSVSPVDGSQWEIHNDLGQFDGVPKAGYTPSPTIGNPGVPGAGVATYGVDEWEGWSFAKKSFWTTADKQGRESFNNASGTVAVADPDEYFDLSAGDGDADPTLSGDSNNPLYGGYYNTSMNSPRVGIVAGDYYELKYDSSWQPESFDDDYGPNSALNSTNNQAVELLAVFNNGQTIVVDGWNSDGPPAPQSPTYKAANLNENRTAAFFAPAGATSVRFEFNMANAANDWWWAVDNLKLNRSADDGMGNIVVSEEWSEDFEDVDLQDSVNERVAFSIKQTAAVATPETLPREKSFSDLAPGGWRVDNTGLPAGTVGKNDIGVYEWEGWNFAPLSFWTFADGQRRGEFTKCVGNCAIADSDEWTDLGSIPGTMDTILESPEIDIAGVQPGNLQLSFDSSWRPEDAQRALVTVDYGDGVQHTVLEWQSNEFLDPEETMPNPLFHDGTNTNESVSRIVNNPFGASTAKFRFAYLGGNNNWWWAIDNIQVRSVPEPGTCMLALVAAVGMTIAAGRRRDRGNS